MSEKKESDGDKRRRFKGGEGGAKELKDKRGLNRIPQWLTQEKGLPDWLAGAVVVIAGGLLMTLFVFIMTQVWPAG